MASARCRFDDRLARDMALSLVLGVRGRVRLRQRLGANASIDWPAQIASAEETQIVRHQHGPSKNDLTA